MYFNPDETFILDTRFGYGTGTIHPLDLLRYYRGIATH
jgi:hypothetical protein